MAGNGQTAEGQARYPVPDGFRPLLESLARETLRNQPNDIYEFGSLFFDCLLQYRNDHGGTVPIGDPEEYNKFKAIIKDHAMKKDLLSAAPTMQQKRPDSDAPPSAPTNTDADHNQEDCHATPSDEHAATLIQASFRTMHQRKQYLEMKEQMNDAATKIQANFRGYKSRKEVDSRTHSRISGGESPHLGDNSSPKGEHDPTIESEQKSPSGDYQGASVPQATGGKGKRRGGRGKRQQEEGIKWHVAKPKNQGNNGQPKDKNQSKPEEKQS